MRGCRRPGAAARSVAKRPFESGVRAETRSHSVHSFGQRRQVLFDDQPDGPQVNAQVTMHDHVAKSCKFPPWDLRFGTLDLARQALAGLGQGLQVADYCVLHEARAIEAGTFGVRVLADPVQAVAHVRQQYPVRLWAWIHSGTAFAITRSRSAGCKLASVTTSTRRPSKSCASSNRPPKARALVPGARVTSRSTSLLSLPSPRLIEPKTRTPVTPRLRARASSSARWTSISACMGRSVAILCGPGRLLHGGGASDRKPPAAKRPLQAMPQRPNGRPTGCRSVLRHA